MVITVYADRRSHEVAEIAGRLARAIAASGKGVSVALVGPKLPGSPRSPGIETAQLSEGLAPQDVSALLANLSSQYLATVVALSGAPSEQVLAAFDASDRVLLVSDPSVASIRGTQRALKLCLSLGYGADKTSVVLHAFGEDAPLAPADAAVAFKRDIYFTLPAHGAAAGVSEDSYSRLAGRLMART
jgi:hypothetical protein